MLQQAFLQELDGGRRSVLGFGWHPDVPNGRTTTAPPETNDFTHEVTKAAITGQRFRFVFDELLIGNALEEIACRDGSFSRVPLGTTPDDIANCAVANDLLTTFCPANGEHAVCIVNGVPVGVADEDENGSVDNTQLIAGAVRLVCGTINVGLNRESSFWQPAGNQLVPALQAAEASLGPAIIALPDNGLLPAGQDCRLDFAPDVTDKDYIRPCAPTGGVEDTDDLGDCQGGDLSAFRFRTVDLTLDTSSPANNAMNVAVTTRTLRFNYVGNIDAASATAAQVTVMEGATPRTDFTTGLGVVGMNPLPTRVEVRMNANLVNGRTYTVTVAGLTDTFGIAVAPVTITFNTAP